MRYIVPILFAICTPSVAYSQSDTDLLILRRGDANDDAAVNISDSSFIADFLFNGGDDPPCENQADVNHDGYVDVSDSVYLIDWLFNGGAIPPSPGPYATTCSDSPSPTISCDSGCV